VKQVETKNRFRTETDCLGSKMVWLVQKLLEWVISPKAGIDKHRVKYK